MDLEKKEERTNKERSHTKHGRKAKQLQSVRSEGQKNKEKGKRSLFLILAFACIAVSIGGGLIVHSVSEKRKETREAAALLKIKEEEEKKERKEEEEKIKEQEDGLFDMFIEAGRNVFDSITKRPQSVELEEGETEEFLKVKSCLIDSKTGKIVLESAADFIPVSDDKYYYLFSLQPYEGTITGEKTPIAKTYKNIRAEFKFPRHLAGKERGVFQKFVIAVKRDEKYVAVSTPQYITNQEAVAKYNKSMEKPSSKKGLLVDPNKLRTSELDDLGVKHAAYNIPVSRILGETTNAIYPTVYYSYNGKSYAFNGQVMSEYDLVFSILTNKGIEVTAIILNDASAAYSQLLHPLARSGGGSAPYYAFNGTDESGMEYLAAIGSFLAERYAGTSSERGLVTNWVIGNEINARKEWNYMEYVGLQSYVEEYAEAFRVFYHAIKSINGAGNVYISLDQQWDRNIRGSQNYDAKDILDEFNRQINEEGNIDWGLAIHPYNVPLTSVQTWASSKYVKNASDTSMITMENIDEVTEYMEQEAFLTKDGEVRSIILSELGYTSSKGEEAQAAAIVYAYKKAEANPHIDSILFSRQTDAVEEIVQGLSLGLNHSNGSPKYAYKIYKYMDTDKQAEYTDFAKRIIGIEEWP